MKLFKAEETVENILGEFNKTLTRLAGVIQAKGEEVEKLNVDIAQAEATKAYAEIEIGKAKKAFDKIENLIN